MTNEEQKIAVPRVWISRLTFSDGQNIELDKTDIVVLVGPNNAGKSVALKNIFAKANNKAAAARVVTDIKVSKEGQEADVLAWLKRTARKSGRDPANPTYTRLGVSVSQNHARTYWQNSQAGLKELSKFFVYHLTTDARLSAANPAPNIALTREPLTHPIHYLQSDDSIEEKASAFFREAFGEDLLVHRNAGGEVPLLCGQRPQLHDGEDRVSIAYLRRLEELARLNEQGDGMRSFVGVLLHALVVEHPVVLIDEPEAFLHPPQARLLGQMLVKEAPENRQLFVATHSSDFLRGLLDTDSSRVRVVRIQRVGNVNPIKELDNEGVKNVWGDPILRYSNILDGLFHSKVIVCEGDADCRFYAAAMDAVSGTQEEARRDHIMFVHCGGKARIPIVVRALRNLDVPVLAVCDFDVLSAEKPLRDICESLGREWSEVSGAWTTVRRAIEEKKPELESKDVATELQGILAGVNDRYFPDDARRKIQAVLKRASAWSLAKAVGVAFVPSGEPSRVCRELLYALESAGLLVVPVGELEGFCRTVGSHGPRWVNEVLVRDLAKDPELAGARKFVEKLIG